MRSITDEGDTIASSYVVFNAMYITKLVLEKYKRLMLSNIQRFEYTPTKELQLLIGSNGSGKAQPLDSWIKVPGGWSTMGEMKVGTEVIAKDGSVTKVTGVFPQGKKQIYKITFEDGRTARATGDHLWSVYTGGKTYPIVPEAITTEQIIEALKGSYSHLLWVDLIDPEEGPDVNLPIDPYILGVFLSNDGLKYKRSYDKFIPAEYMSASRKQRLELLQGLMDTDGYIDRQSTSSYSTSSPTLANHVTYLVRSLGGCARISTDSKGRKVKGRLAYRVNIRYKKPSELFTLPAKKERANDDGQYTKILKLRIKSVEPDGYEEAQCIRIDHPDRLYVTDDFVVTHNSSILEELTPLPSHHSNFLKGGIKHLECIHKESKYELTSEYNTGTGEHTFIKDGDVLNDRGTVSVQRELVEREFGVTREIHELLVGITPFTSLSTAKRREWLTRMSPVDLSYAFTVYNKVRTIHRDQQGVVKHLTKRMARENQDLPDESEKHNHLKAIDRLTEKLNRLFEERKSDTSARFRDVGEAKSVIDDLVRKASHLLKNPPVIPPHLKLQDMEALQDLIHKVNHRLEVERSLLEQAATEHEQLVRETPRKDEQLTDEQIEQLKSSLTDLKHQLSTFQTSGESTVFPLVEIPMDRNPEELLKHTFTEWVGLMGNFPDNSDGIYSQQKGQEARDRLQTLKNEQQQLENEHQRVAQRLMRLKGCEALECPNCAHNFTPGVDPGEIVELEAKSKDLHERLTELATSISDTQQYIESFTDYSGFVRAFKRLTEHSDSTFGPVWDYCLENQVMYRSPKQYISQATAWYHQMEQSVARSRLQQKIDILEHKLRYVQAIDRDALSRMDQRRQQLEENVARYTESVHKARSELRELETLRSQMSDYLSNIDHIATAIESWRTGVDAHVEHLYQEAVRTETQSTQITMAQHQDTLSRIQQRNTILTDMEVQHEEAKQLHKDFDYLAKALAPTDGLIGKYLMGFMQSVVQLVNAIIAEIWTYPLEVLPSKVERDGLDYKFPMSVNNGAVTPPDISLGSASQVDIVNFAFKLLVMKFLHLEDFPLYLDEFGSTFDDQHRFNLIPFITRMVELGQVKQIFYISHYESIHGAMNQAEVCVLDPTNITVPQVYNQHVVIS